MLKIGLANCTRLIKLQAYFRQRRGKWWSQLHGKSFGVCEIPSGVCAEPMIEDLGDEDPTKLKV